MRLVAQNFPSCGQVSSPLTTKTLTFKDLILFYFFNLISRVSSMNAKQLTCNEAIMTVGIMR